MTELRLLLSIVTAVTGLSGKGGQFLVYSSQQTHTSAQGLSFWCLAGLSAVLARPFSPGVTYTQIPRNILGFNYYPNYHLPPKLRSWKITSAISLCLRHLLSLPERLTVSTQSISASISHPAPNCSNVPEHRSWDFQGLCEAGLHWHTAAFPAWGAACPDLTPIVVTRLDSTCSRGHQRFSRCSRGQELPVSPTSAD